MEMKKLMVMAAVMGLGFAAQASDEDLHVTADFSAYKIDKSPSSANASLYSFFALTADDVRSLGISTVSYTALANWLNVEDAADRLAEAQSEASESFPVAGYDYSGDKLYYVKDRDTVYDYAGGVGLAIYNDGVNQAFKTIVSDNSYSDYTFNFYESKGASDWIPVETVPEPTSGLLLLIGLAGIALKRKC